MPELAIIDYTNWRGERRKRIVSPHGLRLARTEWHPELQWLLQAEDMEKEELRDFAMKDIHSWEELTEKSLIAMEGGRAP